MYKYLAVALHGSVVRIALNRPEVFNAFHRDMALELQHALREAGADANVRAVLLTGEGRAFCSGQDLAEAGSLANTTTRWCFNFAPCASPSWSLSTG